MIKDLKQLTSGKPVTGSYLISNVEYKPFSNKSGTFLSCEFTDMSGSIKGIMWEVKESHRAWLKSDMVVTIAGTISVFKEVPQIAINTITECTDFDRSTLVPSLGPYQIDTIFNRLVATKVLIQNPVCRLIWDAVLSSPFVDKLKVCPGGKGTVHHAYCGGLLQHTESMVRIAGSIAAWLCLDLDVVATGCLIHDIGKIEAYKWSTAIDMTDAGRLLHHTIIGDGLILQMAQQNNISLDNATFLKLRHIVISHHADEGLTKPMFPEAVAVSLIDNLDATTTHAVDFASKVENKDVGTNWTKYCQLTGRQYFVPDAATFPIEII